MLLLVQLDTAFYGVLEFISDLLFIGFFGLSFAGGHDDVGDHEDRSVHLDSTLDFYVRNQVRGCLSFFLSQDNQELQRESV